MEQATQELLLSHALEDIYLRSDLIRDVVNFAHNDIVGKKKECIYSGYN